MKKTIFKYAAVVVTLALVSLNAMAQTDTLTKPYRTSTFPDPKITDDNSKVLIDTSSNVTDSLLNKKRGKNKSQQKETDAKGELNKPEALHLQDAKLLFGV